MKKLVNLVKNPKFYVSAVLVTVAAGIVLAVKKGKDEEEIADGELTEE
jgi:hypothetical protein